jgi:endonuclease/exonuclease/phosphatase (EEP) superfamily protein YafD
MLGGGVVCLTKERPGEGIAVRLPVQGQYRRLDVVAADQRLTLFIVDMRSNPFVSRRECLLQLAEDADALGDRPLVVVGDFNTPSDSAHFDPLRIGHRHAFEASGSGYSATWPVPLPVLCLDHIWINRWVDVSKCRHDWSSASDHRPVLAELTVVPASSTESETFSR